MAKRARVIAFYLPQFHPIPENDQWWGKGFTEWTNVGKAKPLFRGHYQPRVPADLGYYDLRVPEVREQQAELARYAGIEGFAYWHYWFGNGKRLLERPFNEVLASGKPDFPFCLAWANETWKGFGHGLTNRNVLIEQLYPGVEDYEAHFYEVLPALKDKRYIKVDGKPLFLIYKPFDLPLDFIPLWRKLAKENGLDGLHFVGQTNRVEDGVRILNLSFDAVNIIRLNDYLRFNRSIFKKIRDEICKHLYSRIYRYNYSDMMHYFSGIEDCNVNVYPTIFPGWDHTPRSGKEGLVIHDSTPLLFSKHVDIVLERIKDKPMCSQIVFLKSWNEWAEGNYMEPDLKFGLEYIESLKNLLKK